MQEDLQGEKASKRTIQWPTGAGRRETAHSLWLVPLFLLSVASVLPHPIPTFAKHQYQVQFLFKKELHNPLENGVTSQSSHQFSTLI